MLQLLLQWFHQQGPFIQRGTITFPPFSSCPLSFSLLSRQISDHVIPLGNFTFWYSKHHSSHYRSSACWTVQTSSSNTRSAWVHVSQNTTPVRLCASPVVASYESFCLFLKFVLLRAVPAHSFWTRSYRYDECCNQAIIPYAKHSSLSFHILLSCCNLHLSRIVISDRNTYILTSLSNLSVLSSQNSEWFRWMGMSSLGNWLYSNSEYHTQIRSSEPGGVESN